MTIVNKAMANKTGEADQQGGDPTPSGDQRDLTYIGLRRPPRQMPGAKRGTCNEEDERHQHARIAASGSVKRAGCTAAAELHAQSEQERADKDRNADRPIFSMHRLAEKAALREHGKE